VNPANPAAGLFEIVHGLGIQRVHGAVVSTMGTTLLELAENPSAAVNDLLCISEVGVASPAVLAMAALLEDAADIRSYGAEPESSFNSVGGTLRIRQGVVSPLAAELRTRRIPMTWVDPLSNRELIGPPVCGEGHPRQ